MTERFPLAEAFARCLDRNLFAQIRRPDIDVPDELDYWKELAQGGAIGYVVAPDSALPRSGDMLWLIVHERGQMWRWSLTPQSNYDNVCSSHPWFAELPQIFLV